MRTLTASIALALTVSAAMTASDTQRRTRTPPRDRGEASMTLATVAWEASGATARLANGKLTITANRSQRKDGVSSRQSLILQIEDYKGPGDYVASPFGSMFVGVGIDTEAVAAGDDDATTRAAIATLSKAKHLQLMGAKITITAASDTEISGTFSRPSPPSLDQPGISGGTFRAVMRP